MRAFVSIDVGAQLVVRRELPDRAASNGRPCALLVGIGDRARFQFAHRRESALDLRLHLFEIIFRKPHPADIEREPEIVVAQKIFLEPRPERVGCHVGS